MNMHTNRYFWVVIASILSGHPLLANGSTYSDSIHVKAPDGIVVSVFEGGRRDAPTAIMIHGYMQCHLAWCKQFEGSLARRFHLIAYDIRGHGESEKPLDPAFYTDRGRFADELEAVMDASGAQMPIIIAWSHGACIVADYIAQYGTQRLAGIVFVAPDLSADSRFDGCAAPVVERTHDERLSVNMAATREFLRACWTTQPTQSEFEDMVYYNALVPTQVRRWFDTSASYNNVLQSLDVPVLLIHGTCDKIINYHESEWLKTVVSTAQLSLFHGAGHLPFREDSRRFDAEVLRFANSSQVRARQCRGMNHGKRIIRGCASTSSGLLRSGLKETSWAANRRTH